VDQDVPTAEMQSKFFRIAFNRHNGYVCLAFLVNRNMQQKFFKWPEELPRMIDAIADAPAGSNVYYCPQLLHGQRLSGKEDVAICPTLWADLDSCDPSLLLVAPTVVTETSPNRFQALWLLEETIPPAYAEDLSRRVAYFHAPQGADKSGWDLTQLLRVPGTYNYKYENGADTPLVCIRSINTIQYRDDDFIRYPEVARTMADKAPTQGELPEGTALELLQRYQKRRKLAPQAFGLFQDKPGSHEDWSSLLWRLQQYCYEAGMTQEEVFVVCRDAACNKFARDGRPNEQLWRDVGRGYVRHMENVNAVVIPDQELAPLLSEQEKERLKSSETFVERYIKWASNLGDAAPQYHEAGAFIILSSLLAARVQLPTSFGTLLPNLWFMILADTTLTRKSTAMDIAVDLLLEVDPDVVMATDGSVEGLLQGLQGRPGRSSIFLRDEFTGLLEGMTKKDYMAGMAETFTKLYDGKYMKRVLRKEIIEVRDPILIVFAGGIKSRTQQLLTLDWVSSGFMPRFIFLSAETDVTRVQPLGPPKERDLTGREELLEEIRFLSKKYSGSVELRLPKGTVQQPKKWFATLSSEAWARHELFEKEMTRQGVSSERPEILTPVYARLAISTLKAAILLAAAEAETDEVVVEEIHLLSAIKYCEQWRMYAIDIINGVGQSAYERDMARVLASIKRSPGISRSRLMQNHHLTAQMATQFFSTLEQRGLIQPVSYGGRGTAYNAINVEEKT
jgi:hypothetical protein